MSDDSFKWVVLSGCWLLYFVFGLSVTSLAPLVPEITAELSLSRADMGLVLGAWQFVYIFLAIPVGFALQRLVVKAAFAGQAQVRVLDPDIEAHHAEYRANTGYYACPKERDQPCGEPAASAGAGQDLSVDPEIVP